MPPTNGLLGGLHPIAFNADNAGDEFSPFYLGTNLPLYTPHEMANESLAPIGLDCRFGGDASSSLVRASLASTSLSTSDALPTDPR